MSAAAKYSEVEIQRARNVTCGAAVKPSTGEWIAYQGSSAYIPNYWNIESEGYGGTGTSGFCVSGYVHDTDAHILAAGKTMLAALVCIRDMPGPMIDGPGGPRKFLAHDAVVEIVNAAIAKAEGR